MAATTLMGTNGNDTFQLTGQAVVVDGLAGDDTFYLLNPTEGTWLIQGGAGWDEFVAPQSSALLVQLQMDLGAGTFALSGGSSGTVHGIEAVEGTFFADDITGDDGDNFISGGNGADTLLGMGGNDTLQGFGAASIDGGDGNDVVYNNGYPQDFAGPDYVPNIIAPILRGGAGDDVIISLGGPASMLGPATLVGGWGNDVLRSVGGPAVAVFSGAISDYVITPMQDGDSFPSPYAQDEPLYVLVHDRVALRDGDDKVFLSVGQMQFADGTVNVADFIPGAGTDGNDSLAGTAGADAMMGLGGNDVIDGGAGNDWLTGGAGNDTLDGGNGYDIAYYLGQMQWYDVATDGANATVTTSSFGVDGETDTLHSIEQLEFADARVVFDPLSTPGVVYRMFEAAMGRTPDAPTLGWLLGMLGSGWTLETLATVLLGGAELGSYAAGLSNTQFVTALYENVLHREPDDGGLAFSVAALNSGVSRPALFANFIQSQEAASVAAKTPYAYLPTVFGTAGADTLAGGADARDVEGGAGIDTVVFSGPHTLYSIGVDGTVPPPGKPFNPPPSTSGGTVDGPDGFGSTLHDVERVQFDDVTIALDLGGHAGEAYRLYQTAFARTPDVPGLTYQVHALDAGASLSQIAANFIASPEFAATYGNLDNTAFVTLLYENALHREPDEGGLAFHVANLNAGMSRADVLIAFSESPENQVNLMGQMVGGIVLDS